MAEHGRSVDPFRDPGRRGVLPTSFKQFVLEYASFRMTTPSQVTASPQTPFYLVWCFVSLHLMPPHEAPPRARPALPPVRSYQSSSPGFREALRCTDPRSPADCEGRYLRRIRYGLFADIWILRYALLF